MGTGSYALGQELASSPDPVRGHILITHTHWDHIQGLPFFAPFFRPGNEWDIYAPRGLGTSLRDALSAQMQHTYFPLNLEQLGATIRYHDLVEGTLALDEINVEAQYLNHTALTLGYRIAVDGAAFVYALDHEPFIPSLATDDGPIEGADLRHAQFLAGADLVIHDAQYTAAEYGTKVGWGHSTPDYVLRVARAAGVQRVALAHHDPLRDDHAVDAVLAAARALADGSGVEVDAAAEGLVYELRSADRPATAGQAGVGLSRPANTRPAVAEQSALIAGSDPARMGRLLEVLREDRIPATLCAMQDAPAEVTRLRPTLLILVSDDDEAIRDCLQALSRLGGARQGLFIAVVGDREVDSTLAAMGVADQLVEPFTAGYARARLRAWLMRRACRWNKAPVPDREADRLSAVRALNILDQPPDPGLEQLTRLATDMFGVPIAAVTLVDRDRQFFSASRGLPIRETPRDESFCAYVVADPKPLVVPDATLDERFADNPSVLGPIGLRFYAAHPLTLSSGHCVGTFFIADNEPRSFGDSGVAQLSGFAALARGLMEGRSGAGES
jgi:ribonuclease BN (tRNA processing enzyme)/GAF domain-containing protein